MNNVPSSLQVFNIGYFDYYNYTPRDRSVVHVKNIYFGYFDYYDF